MASKPLSKKPASRRGPGRPRDDRARQAILDSTLALLKEVGFNELSIEGIAARAGVGKTTVYRWWPNKAGLVIDAFLQVAEPELRFPRGDSTQDAIRQQMRRLTKLWRGEVGHVLAGIIGAGQSQPEMLEAVRRHWVEPRRTEARALMQQAQRRGEIRSDITADTILDILYGAFYFRLLIGHAEADNVLVEAIFQIANSGIQKSPVTRR